MQSEEITDIRRSFEERARDFLRDVDRGEGFRTECREVGHMVSGIKVGIGEYAGLVFKSGYVHHAQMASNFYDTLIEHFKERGYEPYSYGLVKPNFWAAGERVGIVQDYFPEPSMSELMNYLVMRKKIGQKERKFQRTLNPAELGEIKGKFCRDVGSESRCRQLLDEEQNKDITLADVREVERELMSDTDCLHLWVKPENVIVLGRRKDLQRTGLAIIDY